MSASDIPPPSVVIYKSLSAQAEEAEKQKDIIVQVLKNKEGAQQVFKEETQPLHNVTSLVITCLSCYAKGSEPSELVVDSIRTLVRSSTQYELNFQTQTTGKVQEWKLRANVLPPLWIASGQMVKVLFTRMHGLKIKTQAKASSAAYAGQKLRVQLEGFFTNSKFPTRTLEVVATAPGEVEYAH